MTTEHDDTDGLRIGGHQWVEANDLVKWPHCAVCGIIRRHDDKNKPCKGAAKIGLRNYYTEGETALPSLGAPNDSSKVGPSTRTDSVGTAHHVGPSPEPKITKRAQIGNTVFHEGIKVSTVIDRAYREYEYQQLPENEALRKVKADAFREALRSPLAAPVNHRRHDDQVAQFRTHQRSAPSATEASVAKDRLLLDMRAEIMRVGMGAPFDKARFSRFVERTIELKIEAPTDDTAKGSE